MRQVKFIINHIKIVDNNLNLLVKRIRSGNEIDFKNFMKKKKIQHEFSAPWTPQQNGVVKRKNITLIEPARTILGESKLLIYSWLYIHGMKL